MAKTKKHVRILKAGEPSYWYVNKIGRVFEFEREGAFTYKTREKDGRLAVIRKEDAEVVVTEKRQAKVGERVLITDKYGTSGEYKNGDILTADLCIGYAITTKEVGLTFIFHSEYEVIVNNEVKNEEADGMENVEKRYDTAVENMNTATENLIAEIEELRLAAYAQGYEDARRELMAQAPVEKTVQKRRDEIVEQAKADIEKLSNRYQRSRYCGCSVEFVVNHEKRTVVALLKSVGRGAVKSKGIAKAAPDDCFNVHIGKAIALHRALGLEVPDEYLNAPQPTEVRVGDIVMHTVTSEIAPVISDNDWPPLTGAYVYQRDVEAARRYALIIDDSRTEEI